MANVEIDPILKKAFRLLHSRSKDSTDQLKALLDEVRRLKHGKSLSTSKDPFTLRKESPIPRIKQSSPSNILLSKGSDLKNFKNRDDELPLHISKRPKLDSPHNPFNSHPPSPTPSLKSESSSRSRKSDESDSDADMNDLAMEIGINCTVCKSFEQISGNQLVECQECHSLYHQECHKPPVSHQDITDPRLVWYCAKCSRTMKKQSSVLPTSTTSTSSLGIRAAGSLGGASSVKASGLGVSSSLGSSQTSRPSPSKTGSLQRSSPFTNLSSVSRNKIGSNNNNSSSSSSGSGGSGKSSSGSSNSNNNNTRSNATGPPGANSLLNAERRVHLMKKKAAAKNAERRKI